MGKAAEQREFADRQPIQAQPQQVVGLVRVLYEFLQLVEHVTVQEAEEGPVDVQRVGSAEPGAGEQREDVFAVGFDVAAAQSAKGPIVIAWMLPWGIAMILLAARIWQAAGQPATTSEPQPAAEPVSTS